MEKSITMLSSFMTSKICCSYFIFNLLSIIFPLCLISLRGWNCVSSAKSCFPQIQRVHHYKVPSLDSYYHSPHRNAHFLEYFAKKILIPEWERCVFRWLRSGLKVCIQRAVTINVSRPKGRSILWCPSSISTGTIKLGPAPEMDNCQY